MSISPTNIYYIGTSYANRAVATPLVNTAEITRGMYIVPSADPLYPSSTAYGTNANAAVGDYYVTSADVLAQRSVTNANTVTTQNSIESGTNLQEAMSIIDQQTPRFNSETSVFATTTTKTGNVQTQSATASPIIESQPSNTFSNFTTTTPIVEDRLLVTGKNANLSPENAKNLAAVNAN